MELTELDPIPTNEVNLDDSFHSNDEDKSWLPNWFNINHIRKGLLWVQRNSIWPLLFGYAPLHLMNTLVVPLIEPTYAPNDVLTMVRELLPSYSHEVLTYTIGAHVISGVTLSAINLIRSRHKKGRKFIKRIEKEDISHRKFGLIGGLSGYFVGLYKKSPISPQTASGYLLLPFLLYHVRLMKHVPEAVGVDIDFDFVKWFLFNNTESAWTRWFLGILPLTGLIASGTYHMIGGLVQFCRLRSLNTRRIIFNLIIGLNVAGIISLWRLSSVKPMSSHYNKIIQSLFTR
ncbi:HBR155Wp [Eremothecium sinecaudum]|uniref:HBR155Wp n=1 Tax=Eremothecium sinecaudum TaxID=45286 RepID=A0A125RE03_9SACH|nr:HBR155Wp [Eremothecium sinecaudum]AMD19056.1 HBR155Wp [Eremothecium sinecaudum]